MKKASSSLVGGSKAIFDGSKEEILPSVRVVDQETTKEEVTLKTVDANVKRQKMATERVVRTSQVFEPKDLLHVFCNAIMAGLNVHKAHSKRTMKRLPEGSRVDQRSVLELVQGKVPLMKSLTVERIMGSAKKRGIMNGILYKSSYSILGLVAVGETSKIFRAVRDDNFECIVKMYVREVDDSGYEIENFNQIAKTAVKREMALFHEIYPELKDYVWIENLCDRWCLLLPLLQPLSNEDRNTQETKDKVREVLKRIAKKQHKYLERDQRWSRLGYFDGKIFAFGLDGLTKSTDDPKEVADAHMRALEERLLVSRSQSL